MSQQQSTMPFVNTTPPSFTRVLGLDCTSQPLIPPAKAWMWRVYAIKEVLFPEWGALCSRHRREHPLKKIISFWITQKEGKTLQSRSSLPLLLPQNLTAGLEDGREAALKFLTCCMQLQQDSLLTCGTNLDFDFGIGAKHAGVKSLMGNAIRVSS